MFHATAEAEAPNLFPSLRVFVKMYLNIRSYGVNRCDGKYVFLER